MGRCSFFEYKGKRMFHIDINNCSAEEFDVILAESGKMIRNEPHNSVLSIAVGGEGTPIFTNRDMFIQYLCLNAPHVKASAVAGLPSMKAEMFSGVLSGSSRDLRLFKTADEAKEWLASIG
jgi:hypothetical protein